MADIEKRVSELLSDKEMVTNIITLFMAGLIIWIIGYFLYKITKQSRKCSSLKDEVSDKPTTLSISDPDLLSTPIRDFYIKTAYNCCSIGDYANDYVATCMLIAVIKQGVRCLDFEVFSIDNLPVIATSTSNSFNEKETYNSIPFSEAIAIISDQAFSGEINSRDPLFIHLRIKSNNVKMFWAMNDMINQIENLYKGEVTPKTPLSELMGKVIIIVNNSNKAYFSAGISAGPSSMGSSTGKVHNMVSGDSSFYMYKYEHIQNLSSAEISEIKKPNAMTLVIPSAGSNPENIDLNKIIELNCNMVAMKYQQNDPRLIYYNQLFDTSAFILKSSVSVTK
jgi:hypothetical protein